MMTSSGSSPVVFNTTKRILCQAGAIKQLGGLCRSLAMTKVLLVTDLGILNAQLHESASKSLIRAGISFSIYADVQADPPEAIVLDALQSARREGVDGVVGLGGGSSMDVAKLIAALAYSPQTLSEAYGVDNLENDRLPLIQIPTTAGTGSEVTPISIITTGETSKTGVVSHLLLPDIALLDPELTIGLPTHVTAATGIDAMVHAIEAYTSVLKKNAYSDMLAREALRLMSANIELAVQEGENLEARAAMLLGSLMAGQAFANAPVAAVHALAYPLGGHFHIPHGLSNSLVLPYVLRFNAEVANPLYAELTPIILQQVIDPGTSESLLTNMLIEYIEGLINRLGLPSTLSDVDIPKGSLPMLARDAMKQERLLVNNPRVLTEQDVLQIYEAAF